MTFEAPITNCVDCNKPLPFAGLFEHAIRCSECLKKFMALSKEEREKANKEVAKRFEKAS